MESHLSWKSPIILGAIAGSGKFDFVRNQQHRLSFWNVNLILEDLENSKLIARPISCMSDKEHSNLAKISRITSVPYHYGDLRFTLTLEGFKYLLSIGVLPESLADENVIWREYDS